MELIGSPTDIEIKVALERELDATAAVHRERIGITVKDGEVSLSGVAGSSPEKAAAVTAALRIRGVAAIVDDISVRHEQPRTSANVDEGTN